MSSTRQNKVWAYILFWIWPLFSLIFALVNYRSSFAKNIVWFFSAFFGFTFVISNEGMDANRYRDYLIEYHHSEMDFSQFWSGLQAGTIGRGDYYEPLLSFFVSRFTDDYRFLFAIFGLIFGYFYSRNIWYLIEKSGKQIKTIAVPFIILFAFIVPIWTINGVRFYTALQIYFFSVLYLLINRDKRYIVFSVLSIFIHVAFTLPVALLLIFYFVRLPKIVYPVLLIVGLFFVNLDIQGILNLLPELSGVAADRVGSYTHPEMVKAYFQDIEQTRWFVRWRVTGIKLLSFFIIIYLLFVKGKKLKEFDFSPLLYFGIIVFSITSILSIVPSVARMFDIATLSFLAVLFLFIQKEDKNYWMRFFSPLTIIPVLLYVVVEIRVGIERIGINTIFMNPVVAAYFENETAIIELIK